MNFNNLEEIYSTLGEVEGSGDKNSVHSYISYLYTLLLTPYQFKPITLLEIGVGHGYSLQLWGKFFVNAERIIGIDIDIEQVTIKNFTKAEIIKCDGTNKEEIDKYFSDIRFSIVVDDGSHDPEDQKKSFELFYPKMDNQSLYVLEDVKSPEMIDKFFREQKIPYFIYSGREFKNRKDDCAFIVFKN